MISVTSLAAAHLVRMVEERSKAPAGDGSPEHSSSAGPLPNSGLPSGRAGLRIVVEKGGCAGMQYTMRLDTEALGDQVNEAGGALVLVDPESVPFIDGSELDYCDDLVGTGFRLRNPRASRSCGCGTSFEPTPEPAGNAAVE